MADYVPRENLGVGRVRFVLVALLFGPLRFGFENLLVACRPAAFKPHLSLWASHSRSNTSHR